MASRKDHTMLPRRGCDSLSPSLRRKYYSLGPRLAREVEKRILTVGTHESTCVSLPSTKGVPPVMNGVMLVTGCQSIKGTLSKSLCSRPGNHHCPTSRPIKFMKECTDSVLNVVRKQCMELNSVTTMRQFRGTLIVDPLEMIH